MATLRQFRLTDLSKISKCNLDPYTETYDINFYLEYHAKWPSLFQVCEDSQGNIIGYSESLRCHVCAAFSLFLSCLRISSHYYAISHSLLNSSMILYVPVYVLSSTIFLTHTHTTHTYTIDLVSLYPMPTKPFLDYIYFLSRSLILSPLNHFLISYMRFSLLSHPISTEPIPDSIRLSFPPSLIPSLSDPSSNLSSHTGPQAPWKATKYACSHQNTKAHAQPPPNITCPPSHQHPYSSSQPHSYPHLQ